MEEIERAVQGLPGAAFAVDDRLRVVAWNRKAEDGLGLAAGEAIGRLCYQAVPAVDVETGLPCYEACPLVRGSPVLGWAHNRVLKSQWSGGRRTRLDCFLLNCLLPTSQKTTICFVEPPTVFQMETHSHVLEAIEAIYPTLSGALDVRKTLAIALQTVLRKTAADSGEVFLLDPETGELVVVEHAGVASRPAGELRRSAIGERFSQLVAGSDVPLLAIVPPDRENAAQPAGCYICAPLVADGRVTGALAIASARPNFNVAAAVRVLFPVAAQLGVYLRWARLEEDVAQTKGNVRSSASRLRFRSLGPFEVYLDGETIPPARFQRFKALTALKFLVAHRGRPIPREALIEVLWPEAEPARASANLRVVLHALRRALKPGTKQEGAAPAFVLNRGDLVYLDPSEVIWVDAEEFVRRARRGAELAAHGRGDEAIEELRAAASLYQGEYLEDDPYSDWCLFERERLRETCLALLKQLGALLTARGDVAEAIGAYRRALDMEAGREEVHRELMRLLWELGRRGEALHQYAWCSRVLREELGVEPSTETQALYHLILSDAA